MSTRVDVGEGVRSFSVELRVSKSYSAVPPAPAEYVTEVASIPSKVSHRSSTRSSKIGPRATSAA